MNSQRPLMGSLKHPTLAGILECMNLAQHLPNWRPTFLVTLLWTLTVIAPIRSALAQPESPAGLKIAVVEPIEGSTLPAEFAQNAIDSGTAVVSTSMANQVVLVRCGPELVDTRQKTVRGATGKSLLLPADWFAADSRIFRGVVLGHGRPGESARRDLYTQWYQKWQQRSPAVQSSVRFSPVQIPTDVILVQKSEDRIAAFDWNSDGELSGDEIIPLNQQGLTVRPSESGRCVMVQPGSESFPVTADKDNDLLRLELWTPSTRIAEPDSLLTTVLSRSRSSDTRLWIDLGASRYRRPHRQRFGVGDLAAAYHLAAEQDCDVVVVDLRHFDQGPEIGNRVALRLSNEFQLPTMTRNASAVAPEHLILPTHGALPDLADLAFAAGSVSWEQALSTGLDRLYSGQTWNDPIDPSRERISEHWQPPVLNGLPPQPIGKAAQHPQDLLVGRLPRHLIVAQPSAAASHSSPEERHDRLTYFDSTGQKTTNPLWHTNGDSFSYPWDALTAELGYLAAPATSWRQDKTGLSTQGMGYITGSRAILRRKLPQSETMTLTLPRQDDLPETLTLRPLQYLKRLTVCSPDQLPETVRQTAVTVSNSAPGLQTWWYRVDSWPGGNHGLRLLQNRWDGEPAWLDRQLTIHWFTNDGRLLDTDQPLGHLNASDRPIRWIQVQGLRLNGDPQRPAPDLFAAMPVRVHPPQTEPWQRRPSLDPSPAVTFEGPSLDSSLDWHSLDWDHVLAAWFHPTERYPIRWLMLDRSDRFDSASVNRGVSEPAWWSVYKNDPAADLIAQMQQSGTTPPEILKRVQSLIASDSSDVFGDRLLLHAYDQPALRKQNLEATIATADRILDHCRQQLGGLPDPVDPVMVEQQHQMGGPWPSGGAQEPITDETVPQPSIRSVTPDSPAHRQLQAWLADAAYRKFRAIGYRELPEVVAKVPISDPERQNREFEAAFQQLAAVVPINHPEFVLSRVRRQRRNDHQARALQHLDRYRSFDANPRWYFKKVRDMWDDLDADVASQWPHAQWFLVENNAALQ